MISTLSQARNYDASIIEDINLLTNYTLIGTMLALQDAEKGDTVTIHIQTPIAIIVVIVLLLFGGKKIPELMRGLGKGIKEFKEGVADDADKNDGLDKDTKETKKDSE